MFPKTTSIICSLNKEEIKNLTLEILEADIWKPHSFYFKQTSLKDGLSCHVKWIDDNSSSLKETINNTEKFPQTMKFIQSKFPNEKIGRIFWHKLIPGDIISLHHDGMRNFCKKNIISGRYHVYLNFPKNFSLMFDGEFVNHKNYENSLVNFNPTKLHYYKNTGDLPIYFLVFDTISNLF